MAGECLIVARDEATRTEWVAMITQTGFTPFKVVGVRDALAHLHERHVAAVPVDCPTEEVPEMAMLLRAMVSETPNVDVTVRADLDNRAARVSILDAHPGARLADRSLGASAVAKGLALRPGRRLGDLVVRDGCVLHEPTGLEHKHPLPVRLVAGAPTRVPILNKYADGMAVTRFRKWLLKVGSDVEVRTHQGKGMYSVVVRK